VEINKQRACRAQKYRFHHARSPFLPGDTQGPNGALTDRSQ